MEIASYFEDELLYVRSVELDETESQLPLTDLDCDSMLLVREKASLARVADRTASGVFSSR